MGSYSGRFEKKNIPMIFAIFLSKNFMGIYHFFLNNLVFEWAEIGAKVISKDGKNRPRFFVSGASRR